MGIFFFLDDFAAGCFATLELLLFAAPVAGFVDVAWCLAVLLAPCLGFDAASFCAEEECIFFDVCPFAEPDSRAFSLDLADFAAVDPRRVRDT